jgi:hypothetical protein
MNQISLKHQPFTEEEREKIVKPIVAYVRNKILQKRIQDESSTREGKRKPEEKVLPNR